MEAEELIKGIERYEAFMNKEFIKDQDKDDSWFSGYKAGVEAVIDQMKFIVRINQ